LFPAPRCGGQNVRQTKTLINQGLTYLLPISGRDQGPPSPLLPGIEAALGRLGRAMDEALQGSGT
jgi:hypothetical protein